MIFVYLILLGCGSKSFVDCDFPKPGVPCQELTPEEKAKKSLKNGDYDQAIEYLELAITELADNDALALTEKYRLHPLLASVYAARADIDLIKMSQAQTGAGSSILSTLSTVLPTPKEKGAAAYRACVADVKQATQRLDLIPEGLLAEKKEEIYGKSVGFQKTLYKSAYSVMAINLYSVSPTTGTLDKAQLEKMTEAEAVEILNSLESAGNVPQTDNPELQKKISDTVTVINSEPGEGKKEKLAEYIAKNQK